MLQFGPFAGVVKSKYEGKCFWRREALRPRRFKPGLGGVLNVCNQQHPLQTGGGFENTRDEVFPVACRRFLNKPGRNV